MSVCILRIEGTNCEWETCLCFRRLGVHAEIVHLKQLTGEHKMRRDLDAYDILVIPGGFSAGDYVRAGAIFAARLKAIWRDLKRFIDDGKLVLGICNGFQVLVELGLLPGWENKKQVALTINDSAHFECRYTILKHENRGKCAFTCGIPRGTLLKMPCAHAEGKFFIEPHLRDRFISMLEDNDQIVFRYADMRGDTSAGYPWNPNGSVSNIAAICNPDGNVMGMMPHPERAFFAFTDPEWARIRITCGERDEYGDGRLIFECAVSAARRNGMCEM